MSKTAYFDVGTSNLRLFVLDEKLELIYTAKRALGAKDVAILGCNSVLLVGMKELYDEALIQLSISDSDVAAIYASGMATSPNGICEIPHHPVPVAIEAFAKSGVTLFMENSVFNREILLIAGMKTINDDISLINNVRGEEIEVIGAVDEIEKRFGNATVAVVLPGSHTHVMFTGGGAIKGIVSNFTGELFYALSTQTILAPIMKGEFSRPDEKAVRLGAKNAALYGFNRAIYISRAMSLFNEGDERYRQSYCEGVISGGVVTSLDYYCKRFYPDCRAAAVIGSDYMNELFEILLSGSECIKETHCLKISATKSYALEGLKKIVAIRA